MVGDGCIIGPHGVGSPMQWHSSENGCTIGLNRGILHVAVSTAVGKTMGIMDDQTVRELLILDALYPQTLPSGTISAKTPINLAHPHLTSHIPHHLKADPPPNSQ